MAVEMLDVKKVWGKIKAGFTGGKFYANIPAHPARRFVNGIDPMASESMGISMTPKYPVFGGKGFSDRK
jgi:hypothetical protein